MSEEADSSVTEEPVIGSPFAVVPMYHSGNMPEFRRDSHYGLQFCILLAGEAEVLYQGPVRVFHPGDVWWNMCWEDHSYRFTGKRNFILAINLDVEQLGACGPFSGCNWLAPFLASPKDRYCPQTEQDRHYVMEWARQLHHAVRVREENWRIACWLQIHSFLLHAIRHLNRTGGDPTTAPSDTFSRIHAALDQVWNTNTKPPSLSEAARMCELSPSRFSELFRRTMGVSYGKFAIRVRMTNAAKDLLAGQRSTEEIAEKWGFFDAPHFCHSFKKFYRISPRRFLAQKQNVPSSD